jgi:hypothetical protein
MYSLMRGALKLNASLDRLGGARSTTRDNMKNVGGTTDRARGGDTP